MGYKTMNDLLRSVTGLGASCVKTCEVVADEPVSFTNALVAHLVGSAPSR